MEDNTFEKFSDWFNTALVKNNMDLKEVEEKTDIPLQTLANYCSDLDLPDATRREELAHVFYINTSWLEKLVRKTKRLIEAKNKGGLIGYEAGYYIEDPSYYSELPIQPKDIISAWGLGKGFYLGSAIEKIARAGNKEGESFEKDIRKAIRYLEFAIEEK